MRIYSTFVLFLSIFLSGMMAHPTTPATPFRFEANAGQTDARVRFLSQGKDYRLFLTDDAITLSLRGKERSRALKIRFAGGARGVKVSGKNPSPGKANYLVGTDQRKWRTNVDTFERVAYKGVYRGIDAVFYGSERQLEYDFIVAPGADPGQIRLAVEGAQSVAVNAAGDLVLHTVEGDVVQRKPVIYQTVGGVRRPVGGGYRVFSKGEVGFVLAAYNRGHELVIDPVLTYASYLVGRVLIGTYECLAIQPAISIWPVRLALRIFLP